MAYSDLANNQGVSFNSLNSGVSQGYFTAKTSIPFTPKQVTKSECITYVNIDPTYLPFAEKSNNQIIVKQDLRANEAAISISNLFFIGTITDVTVNGVSITGASFPLDIGNSTTGYTTQLGTYDILVYYADADMPSNYMRIQDSAYNNLCVDGFTSLGPGPYYVTFPSQVVNTSIGVVIESGDGSCIGPLPPPFFPDSPINAVAVSRGTGQYMIAAISKFLSSGYQAGGLYVSSNYGSSWTFVPIVGYWIDVAISDDGSHMLAVEQYGKAYRSANYGVSWSEISSLGTDSFRGPSISGDGQFQLICKYSVGGSSIIFRSNNYGATWVDVWAIPSNLFSSTINSSGSVFLVGGGSAGNSFILRSIDQGYSWYQVYFAQYGGSVNDININASNGWVLASNFGFNNEGFYLIKSNDSGASWLQINGGSAQDNWIKTAVSNTPTGLALYNIGINSHIQRVSATGPVPLATVSNLTSSPVKDWHALGNSDNGQYILAGAYNGLFLSTDYGTTFTAL